MNEMAKRKYASLFLYSNRQSKIYIKFIKWSLYVHLLYLTKDK